jgi:SRSO17 transposase
LANFAVAYTAPTFGVFALLFTGAVLVKGRHTVTRMILAAGIRASHHARFHRFFSQARWEMDILWERLVQLLSEKLLAGSKRIEVVIDETAQKKTGAKIYGAGMVYDNRPKSKKGREREWGLT